jgi:hypothetical protein
MEEKRPIDRKRESSGHADIGTEEDGAIVEMKNVGGRLLIIKERSIYEMVMSDTVDPGRTNINLPNSIHNIIIDKGTESEAVSKTLLTALTLFKDEYISKTVDCSILISLTIDMLSEISILEKEITEYLNTENDIVHEYEERKNQNVSYKLPTIINLDSKCKTIFQKANHIEQILIDIFTKFYPHLGLTKQSHFPLLYKKLKGLYGETDQFVDFISKTVYFMEVIYELRNGFDHRLDYVKAFNFELQTNGNIILPTIELNHKKIKLERTSLNDFLKLLITNNLDIIESTFAYLASKNIRSSGLPLQVRLIPEVERRNKFVRYSFWTSLGEEGFYIQ